MIISCYIYIMKNSTLTFGFVTMLFCLLACKNTPQSVPTAEAAPQVADIKWQDISTAKDLASNQGKDLFIFVHAPWCPKCEAYKTDVFKDPELIELINKHFIPVSLDAQANKDIIWEGKTYSNPNYDTSLDPKAQNAYHELVYQIGAEAIPNLLIFDKSLNNIGKLLGLYEAERVKWYLGNTTGRFQYKYSKK